DYNDEIRQAQLQELTYLNGGSENADVPVVRGKPTLRTRGVPTPAITRGRGGVAARPVGVGVPRGTPTSRGVLSTRGPVSRGRGLLTPRARGVPPAGYRPPPPPPTQETYRDYVSGGVLMICDPDIASGVVTNLGQLLLGELMGGKSWPVEHHRSLPPDRGRWQGRDGELHPFALAERTLGAQRVIF
ncbi:KH domain-containing, RNA-binding, signal transduction-associated protein 3, partial [Eschrichtius robustus]|nr:KH domain-containing, RNA-binding, signal transduction-associated protein 3 [Eschrichtius robustus]